MTHTEPNQSTTMSLLAMFQNEMSELRRATIEKSQNLHGLNSTHVKLLNALAIGDDHKDIVRLISEINNYFKKRSLLIENDAHSLFIDKFSSAIKKRNLEQPIEPKYLQPSLQACDLLSISVVPSKLSAEFFSANLASNTAKAKRKHATVLADEIHSLLLIAREVKRKVSMGLHESNKFIPTENSIEKIYLNQLLEKLVRDIENTLGL